MNATILRLLLVILALVGLAVAGAAPPPNRLALAQQAEKEGKFGLAFQHYLALFQSANGNLEQDPQLRKKVIAMARKLEAPPAIPESAYVHLKRGQDAMDDSPRASDYRNAAKEFRQASQIAPWWADPYCELSSAQEAVGEYHAALVSARYCILCDPNSRKARKLYSKLAEFLELEDRPDAEKAAEVNRRRSEEAAREREFIESLTGTWRQMDDGPICLWKFRPRGSGDFELMPVVQRTADGKERKLSRDDHGYFLCEIAGEAIRGLAISAQNQKTHQPRETVKLSGIFLPKDRILVFRYTFFFDPSDGSLLSTPWETETRFKQVLN